MDENGHSESAEAWKRGRKWEDSNLLVLCFGNQLEIAFGKTNYARRGKRRYNRHAHTELAA